LLRYRQRLMITPRPFLDKVPKMPENAQTPDQVKPNVATPGQPSGYVSWRETTALVTGDELRLGNVARTTMPAPNHEHADLIP